MPKLKKYPKKPKASASLSAMENYLDKCKQIDKENAQIKADMKKKETLKKKISGMRQKR
jgi:hypothetical protein